MPDLLVQNEQAPIPVNGSRFGAGDLFVQIPGVFILNHSAGKARTIRELETFTKPLFSGDAADWEIDESLPEQLAYAPLLSPDEVMLALTERPQVGQRPPCVYVIMIRSMPEVEGIIRHGFKILQLRQAKLEHVFSRFKSLYHRQMAIALLRNIVPDNK